MGLVNPRAIVAEEDSVVDTHIYLVELLAIELEATVYAKLVLQTFVVEEFDEAFFLQRQLLIIVI